MDSMFTCFLYRIVSGIALALVLTGILSVILLDFVSGSSLTFAIRQIEHTAEDSIRSIGDMSVISALSCECWSRMILVD